MRGAAVDQSHQPTASVEPLDELQHPDDLLNRGGWDAELTADTVGEYWDPGTMAPLSATSLVRHLTPRSLTTLGSKRPCCPSLPSSRFLPFAYLPTCLLTQNPPPPPPPPPRAMLFANKLLMRSKAAVARLAAYAPPPFPLWDRLPVKRRAAVLILLFADRRGDLRVVVTMRAASLRSFSGHAAFPGGKADGLDETPYEIARREAFEEIGLPENDSSLPSPFHISHLCYLPHNLARNDLVVRPCVALLHTSPVLPLSSLSSPSPPSPSSSSLSSSSSSLSPPNHPAASSHLPFSPFPNLEPTPLVEESMIPRLDAKEVAAVFSAPFSNFLRTTDQVPPLMHATPAEAQLREELDSKAGPAADAAGTGAGAGAGAGGHWYDGSWITWKDTPWRVHNFYVPVGNQRVTKPRRSSAEQGNLAGRLDQEEMATGRYKVWGMTAHILVDAARIAYGRDAEFEHNKHYGDEEIIVEAAKEWDMGDAKM